MGQERGPNLVFSEDVRGGIIDADMIFICVETPAKKKGGKDGVQPDTRPLKKAVKEISNAGKNGVIVVVKSTVPVGMAERIKGMVSYLLNMVKIEDTDMVHAAFESSARNVCRDSIQSRISERRRSYK